jgi:hypothetical protein
LKFVQGIPFDAARVDADPTEIEMYLDEIEELIVGFPAAMIVSLDETGHCEWVDTHRETVVIPAEFTGDQSACESSINTLNIAWSY